MAKNAICMLNYNGHYDTIQCINSIIKHENISDLTMLLLDNGSNDESVRILEKYVNELKISIGFNTKICNFSELHNIDFQNYRIVLIKSSENYGFAKGNNFLIKHAIRNNYSYITLLNNDTIFTMPSITKLSNFLNKNVEYSVATSNILYYSNADKVWNAGGKLILGTRKYNTNKFVNKKLKKGENVVSVEFITGCFMMVSKKIFTKYGILSDKFFFGEEDYEFCMRMKANKVKMCVLLDNTIFHKVGATINNENSGNVKLNKNLVHHLNRYIDMKYFYSNLKWKLWKKASNCYIFFYLLLKKKNKFFQVVRYVQILNILSSKYDCVDKCLFDKIRKCENINKLLQVD